jgi:hypothetical protein
MDPTQDEPGPIDAPSPGPGPAPLHWDPTL